jgi:glycosyltransferase involved in cell wall biosynthesis
MRTSGSGCANHDDREAIGMTERGKEVLSVVVPAYNEETVLPEFHRRIALLFDALPDYDCEVVYVNDGSRDGTQTLIESLAAHD